MLTNFKLRDEEKAIIDLPNSITKRNLFEKWCFLRGWKAITDNIGDYKFEDRNTKETFWEECDTLEIFSWWKFRDLWNRHLPHVRIRAPCYDTCGECTIFKNAFRYRKQNNRQHKIFPDESSSESDDDESQADDVEVAELATVNVSESFLLGDFAQQEAIIKAAAFHVEKTKVMRELAQKRAQEAKDDIENGVLHPENQYCLVCDYAQNFPLKTCSRIMGRCLIVFIPTLNLGP
jgi:hypothetical protein